MADELKYRTNEWCVCCIFSSIAAQLCRNEISFFRHIPHFVSLPQLTLYWLSTINYRDVLQFFRRRLANIRFPVQYDESDPPLSEFHWKARCRPPGLRSPFPSKALSNEDSLVGVYSNGIYTPWSFETFLLRYPIKRHLSLKRALDALFSVRACLHRASKQERR